MDICMIPLGIGQKKNMKKLRILLVRKWIRYLREKYHEKRVGGRNYRMLRQ